MKDAYITVWIDFQNLKPLDVGEEVVCKVHRTEPFHYELSVPIGWIIKLLLITLFDRILLTVYGRQRQSIAPA